MYGLWGSVQSGGSHAFRGERFEVSRRISTTSYTKNEIGTYSAIGLRGTRFDGKGILLDVYAYYQED